MDRYFDNAATTPLEPRVLREMLPFLSESFGNASSIHSLGLAAAAAVDRARERVAILLGAEDPSQIVFTSGATEANNWVLRAFEDVGGWISPFEHSSVREPAGQFGFRELENDGYTLVPPPEPVSGLLSVVSVSNEVGAMWDVRELGVCARLHADVTQHAGKLPLSVQGLDYASSSAHKLYGPKGIGALYVGGEPPEPLLYGGEHEQGLRSGTLNVPAIVGFGAAAAIAVDEMEEQIAHARALRETFLEALGKCPDFQVNEGDRQSPYILNISFLGVQGESLVIEADQAGYAISAGAACSSRSTEPSAVLTALGLEPEWLGGTVRVSFGRFNTLDSAADLAKKLSFSVEKLRRMG